MQVARDLCAECVESPRDAACADSRERPCGGHRAGLQRRKQRHSCAELLGLTDAADAAVGPAEVRLRSVSTKGSHEPRGRSGSRSSPRSPRTASSSGCGRTYRPRGAGRSLGGTEVAANGRSVSTARPDPTTLVVRRAVAADERVMVSMKWTLRLPRKPGRPARRPAFGPARVVLSPFGVGRSWLGYGASPGAATTPRSRHRPPTSTSALSRRAGFACLRRARKSGPAGGRPKR